jgi:hypothetical protein
LRKKRGRAKPGPFCFATPVYGTLTLSQVSTFLLESYVQPVLVMFVTQKVKMVPDGGLRT